ncbi:MAG TPA: serine/threonine-protein kinase, partial [Gaiellaceae bacterium]|nr:serine/threonine-protein kinase [Gaiellaceae bacterium]
VHRDIKPGNLLLDGRDEVHVGDFGVASAAGLANLTETGTILGTAGYLSPEQAQGERATAASDRYSLAVVAFELLAGRRPFESDSTTAEAARHATAPVPSIRDVKRDLPASFDAVFDRALAKAPSARYPSCAEFVSELRAALHDDAGTTGWILPVASPQTAVTQVDGRHVQQEEVRTPGGTRRPSPRRRLLPLLLLVLLGGGIAAAFAATRDGRGHTAQPKRTPVTIVHTVTQPGTTVEQTVTAPAPPPATVTSTSAPPATTAAATGGPSGTALNSAGYARMKAGDYRGALPLLERAVQRLQGTGSLGEAYADYNLAYTRYALGECDGVLPLLDHSQAIQGRRSEIESLRRDAQKACG